MIQTIDRLTLRGVHIVRHWKPGELPRLLERHDLQTATRIASIRGWLLHIDTIPNLIVTTGLGLAGDMLIDVVTTGLTYHAIGTGTDAPAAGDTTLQTESVRNALSSRSRSGNTLTLSTFYLGSVANIHLREVGIFGGASASATPDSGTLFSRALYNYDNSVNEYDLTFDYDLTLANG